MAFGDDLGPNVKVCCGPRCGQEPDHRALYAAVEALAHCPVHPTGCLGRCRGGVTVTFPGTRIEKVQTVQDVRIIFSAFTQTSDNQQRD